MRKLLTSVVLTAFAASSALAQDDPPELIEVEAAEQHPPLVREAGRLAVYLSDAEALATDGFTSTADIDRALEAVSTDSPTNLGHGWIAYGALVAAQTPEFVDGVREVADYYGRRTVRNGLGNDATYASALPGAAAARANVISRVRAAAGSVGAAGSTIRMTAYTLQENDWAQTRVDEASTRIARLHTASLTPRPVATATLANIGAPGVISSRTSASQRDPAMSAFDSVFRLSAAEPLSVTPALVTSAASNGPSYAERALTLAGLAALDGASEESMNVIDPLLSDPDADNCLRMARLHLHQCIAATRFRYEDPFCIAEHGLSDIAECVTAATAD